MSPIYFKTIAKFWEKYFLLFFLLILLSLFAAAWCHIYHPDKIKLSIAVFLAISSLNMALGVNYDVYRGYIPSAGLYRWESAFNFWGIIALYTLLSLAGFGTAVFLLIEWF